MRQITIAAALAVLLLSGCGQTPPPRRAAPPPTMPTQPRTTVTTAQDEALWHLRVGLNVAALTCGRGGRASVAPAYARMLSRHRALLATAYAAEERRYGSGFDRHQTQLYNRFSNQRSPERFCRSAAMVATRAAGMDSATLAGNARGLLAQLD